MRAQAAPSIAALPADSSDEARARNALSFRPAPRSYARVLPSAPLSFDPGASIKLVLALGSRSLSGFGNAAALMRTRTRIFSFFVLYVAFHIFCLWKPSHIASQFPFQSKTMPFESYACQQRGTGSRGESAACSGQKFNPLACACSLSRRQINQLSACKTRQNVT